MVQRKPVCLKAEWVRSRQDDKTTTSARGRDKEKTEVEQSSLINLQVHAYSVIKITHSWCTAYFTILYYVPVVLGESQDKLSKYQLFAIF